MPPPSSSPSKALYVTTLSSNVAFGVGVAGVLYKVHAGRHAWLVVGLGLSMMPRFNRLSYQICRWPVLVVTYAVVVLEFVAYVCLRLFVRAMEALVATPTHRHLRGKLRLASTYEGWLEAARELDERKGAKEWQANLRSPLYNWPFVQDTIRRLREARKDGDWRRVARVLRLCSRPNVGGVMATQLFSATHTGEPKTVVGDFVDEVATSIAWLAREAVERKDDDERTDFGIFPSTKALFRADVSSYGRTVLSLSGGGILGTYHFGVCRALWERGVLPRIISGTSAGALVSAFVCTRTDDELARDLFDDRAIHANLCAFDLPPLEVFRRILARGVAYEKDKWMEMGKWYANNHVVEDVTFKEAYDRTKRKLAITVCSQSRRAPPVMLTYLTAPNVLVRSAMVGSASIPGFVDPTVLLEKDPLTGVVAPQPGGERYIDGSIVYDIPVAGLREAFNAKFVVACQVNAHISPFLYPTHGTPGQPSRWFSPRRGGEDAWHGGFVLASLELYLRYDMLNKLHWLNDIDATPGWLSTVFTQKFEGSVTVTPHLRLRDFYQIFVNPPEYYTNCMLREGRVATYQKIAMIRTRLAIERALAEACALLERAASGGSRETKWRAWHEDVMGSPLSPIGSRSSRSPITAYRAPLSPVESSPLGTRLSTRRPTSPTPSFITQPADALEWATPQTISRFDDDDDSDFYSDGDE